MVFFIYLRYSHEQHCSYRNVDESFLFLFPFHPLRSKSKSQPTFLQMSCMKQYLGLLKGSKHSMNMCHAIETCLGNVR